MPRSEYAIAVDKVQQAVRPLMRKRGYKSRGRTFNRTGEDGVTHVVGFQMGPSYSALYGRFTINLGVFIPEVAEHHGGGNAGSWIQEYHCCVRCCARHPESDEQIWWPATSTNRVETEVQNGLEQRGFPFFNRFSTRDRILNEGRDRTENFGAGSPPRIVKALIRFGRGEVDEARELLSQQAKETRNKRHPEYVRELAKSLGLGEV